MKYTRTIQVPIEGIDQPVVLSVERHGVGRKECPVYFLSAVCPTGYDLCGHGRFLKCMISAPNTRLRSEKSIKLEAETVLDSLEASVRSIGPGLVLTERTIEIRVESSSDTAYTDRRDLAEFIVSIPSIRASESGECLSWYHHDVFKRGMLKVHVRRKEDGHLEFTAPQADLYDFEKLKALYDSKAHQDQRLAFFFYDELKRLLGMPHGRIKNMSGLFASKREAV